jgi:hypothetical protein
MLPNIFRTGIEPPVGNVQTFERKYRFFLRPGESKRVLFLQDEKDFVNYHEHEIVLPTGRVRVWCSRSNDSRNRCYLCDLGLKKYWVAVGTILDLDGFITREGRRVKPVKRIYAIKYRSSSVLSMYIRDLMSEIPNFTLKYAEFKVSRTPTSNSPSSGDLFTFVKIWKKEDVEKLASENGISLSPYQPSDFVTIYTDYKMLENWYNTEIKPLLEDETPPDDDVEEFEDLGGDKDVEF